LSSDSSDFIELKLGPFCDIFHSLLSEKDAVLAAARGIVVPSGSHKRRLVSNEEGEET
jgi:hypothetical protein